MEGGWPVDPLKKRSVAFASALLAIHFFTRGTLARRVPFILGLPIQNHRDLSRVYVKSHKKLSIFTALRLMSSNEAFILPGVLVGVDALFENWQRRRSTRETCKEPMRYIWSALNDIWRSWKQKLCGCKFKCATESSRNFPGAFFSFSFSLFKKPMAPNLIAMAPIVAMASNPIAMACNLESLCADPR